MASTKFKNFHQLIDDNIECISTEAYCNGPTIVIDNLETLSTKTQLFYISIGAKSYETEPGCYLTSRFMNALLNITVRKPEAYYPNYMK